MGGSRFTKTMNTKLENESFFYNELLTLNKNGLVAMKISGWNNAKGHITLWNGRENQFMDNVNYLLDERSNVIVTEFHFWALKD